MQRKTAGLPNSSLHIFYALGEVLVARVDTGASIYYCDDRFSFIICRRVTELTQTSGAQSSLSHQAPTSVRCAVEPGSFRQL